MYLGIDLGTSNSAIVGNEKGNLRLFKTSDGRDVLPSVLYVDRRGSRFVGTRAYDQGALAPENVASGFKRLMGTKSPIQFGAEGHELTPVEASAEVIRTLLAQAQAEAGEFEREGTVVTVPAAFNQMQNEGTIEAARAAGLDRVGLLQEPIAAAMASLEQSTNRDGQFLVYDIGGGTFDVALVQSIKGAVNIIAHEGINMLGGRDFDKAILNSIIRPWLHENYDLASDYQKDPGLRRLMRLAQFRAEQAKIDLSTRESATIYVSEEDARTSDSSGKEIFIELTVTRRQVEDLVSDQIDDSIALCRKILSDNGLTNDDVDRVVFIGGPSKMPCIRDRVPRELGIAADLKTDPMTAVARGAAIFAESRNWSAEGSSRKVKRVSQKTSGPVQVRYDFESRTSGDVARIRAVPGDGDLEGLRVSATNEAMWDSGQMPLSEKPTFQVPIVKEGENRIRMTVTDKSGSRVDSACAELIVTRVGSTAEGIPATQTLAVKVVDTKDGTLRNTLEALVTKGTLLPAKGSEKFRAASTIRPATTDRLDIELYQHTHGVVEPELNLLVGSFPITSADLEAHHVLRKGDEVIIHWSVDDNGLITASVEIPSLEMYIDKQFYSPSIGMANFAGDEGMIRAADDMSHAQADINSLAEALGKKAGAEVASLRRRLERGTDALANAVDTDDYRKVSEEARYIRQQVSRIRHDPAYRGDALEGELRKIEDMFADLVEFVDRDVVERVGMLKSTARQSIAAKDFERAHRAIEDFRHVLFDQLRRQPEYVFWALENAARRRHLAIDPLVHDRLVLEGQRAQANGDIDGVNRAIGGIYANQPESVSPEHDISQLAGLTRHS